MTHSDIYTKFMIEYDKADITSSYPSLTRYEIATILDKAYLAIIAQKLTANNPRQSTFESDIKAVEDVRPLIKTTKIEDKKSGLVSNELVYKVPDDLLYYISGLLTILRSSTSIDRHAHVQMPVTLVSHDNARPYMATASNMPWVKSPVVYMQESEFHVLVDSYEMTRNLGNFYFKVTYIKNPTKFTDNYKEPDNATFELSDTMAEELIELAILMATRIVESSRLDTESKTRSLEA